MEEEREMGVLSFGEVVFDTGDQYLPLLADTDAGVSRMMSEPITLSDFVVVKGSGSTSSITTWIAGFGRLERTGPTIGP